MHDDDMGPVHIWPGEVDRQGIEGEVELEGSGVLTAEQEARMLALQTAYGMIGSSSRMDLLSLANWIITGSGHVH